MRRSRSAPFMQDPRRPAIDHPPAATQIWVMGNLSSTTPDSRLSVDEVRERVFAHLERHIGAAVTAYSDTEGWKGEGDEPGPAVDVLIAPPEGERRFAYVSSFGSCIRPLPAPAYRQEGVNKRVEFVLAAMQTGDETERLDSLNQAGDLVRKFAKLTHTQPVTVEPGETVAFGDAPAPLFPGSDLVAFAFMEPRLPSNGFGRMPLAHNEHVVFVSPVPITAEELDLARREGTDALNAALMSSGVTEMLDPGRTATVEAPPPPKKGFFARLADLFGKRR